MLYYLTQYKKTKLSTTGGIDDSQTTGIKLLNVDGVDITKPGVIAVSYSTPLDTTKIEYITYSSIDGSNILQGVTRGEDGFSAKTHAEMVDVAFIISRSHINNIVDLLGGVEAGVKIKTAIYDVNGNEVIKTPATTSAVNEITITNSATGNAVVVSATGGDTNIDLKLLPKGTGTLSVTGTTDYETNVTDDDDIPNKKYVDSKSTFRAILTPQSATFRASNYPQLVKNAGTNATDFTLDFDKDTDELCEWEVEIPSGITINSATLYVTFRMGSVTSGSVAWSSWILSLAEGEAWDTAGTTDDFDAETVQDTAGKVCKVSKALTTTTWSAGETLHIRLFRDVSRDDAAADAKFMNAILVIS